MATINVSSTMHGNRVETPYGDAPVYYNVYPELSKIDKDRLKKVKRAKKIIDRLDRTINLCGPCNIHFESLYYGKNFHYFWRDDTNFINFSPNETRFKGSAHSLDKDITLSSRCIDTENRWVIAAVIVHEFAHLAGAPGGLSHAAEKAVEKCGFIPQYDPWYNGSIQKLGAYLENIS